MASNSSKTNGDTESSGTLKRQGSLRRVLPSKTYGDSMLSMSAKMIERPHQSISQANVYKQVYSQFFQEYSIISEYNMLVKHSLPGLYVMPSASSALLWFGVLFVRKGIYQGGIFRFNLHIPESFPDCSCPRVIFESQVFHPNVSFVTGEMEVSHAFPEWRKDVNRLYHLLEHVYRSFYSINVKDPANPEAAHLYINDMEAFVEKVKECVEISHARLYEPPPSDDPNYLKFDAYDEKIHSYAKEIITSSKDEEENTISTGLSWVQFGSLEPFSKPIT